MLDAVAENAARVCSARDALIYRREGDVLRAVGHHGSIPHVGEEMPANRDTPSGRSVLERRTIHVHDLATEAESEFPGTRALQQASGTRTVLATPLVREGLAIGSIVGGQAGATVGKRLPTPVLRGVIVVVGVVAAVKLLVS